MTRWIASIALLAALTLLAHGDEKTDKKDTTDTEVSKAEKEYTDLMDDLSAKARKVGRDAKKQRELFDEYAPKFLAHAKKHPKDATAVKSLTLVLSITRAVPKSEDRAAAMELLKKEYVKSKLIADELAGMGSSADQELVDLARAVYKDNADKYTRALAARALANGLERKARSADALLKNEKLREKVEEQRGKEAVEKIITEGKAAKADAKKYRAALKKDYGDVLPDLSVGEPAPATVSVNLDGKQVKLSELKGKVVVLDFWATWCGPCVRMIPHTREVVDQMKDKPFAFVSVSVDAKKETVEGFLKKTKMPWTHWWDGRGGKTARLWDVTAFPTVYVIDHKGVIRHKQVGYNPEGKELDEVIEKLVKAAEDEKKAE